MIVGWISINLLDWDNISNIGYESKKDINNSAPLSLLHSKTTGREVRGWAGVQRAGEKHERQL